MKFALLPIALVLIGSAVPVVAQNQDATFVNGVNGYINVPANPSLIPSSITLEAWSFFNNTGLNPTNLYPTIARKNVAAGAEEYFIRVQGTGVLRWKVKISATTSVSVDSPTAMPGGVWTHVAGTYDGTTARLYINGVQVAQVAGTGTPYNGGGALRIGKGDDQTTPSEVWSGKLDEVRLWSVARTAAEIQSTMNWQLPSVSNLVSSWRMIGGLDAMGTNPGNLVGTVTFGPSSLALSAGLAPWQTNHSEISLDFDGMSSDGYSEAIVSKTFTACMPGATTVNLAMSLTPNPWDIAITAGPGFPANAGGVFTSSGQAVNINVADPTLTFLNYPNPSPPITTASLPVSFNAPFAASAQAFVVNPLSPDGVTLSSLVEIHVTQGASSIPGPTADDQVVTVLLANPTFCGAPSAIPFYGTNYSQLDVSSNGRVMFGAPTPDPDWTPTVAEATTDYPFLGAWADFSPNMGGSIAISTPAVGVLRVDYMAVPYFASTATATFGIQFDAPTGAVTIDGLGGMTPIAASQFLGISPGILGPATDAGPTAFVAGGPFFTPTVNQMIYAFGPSGSLAPGLSTIVFTVSINGGYDFSAY